MKNKYLIFVLIGITLLSNQFINNDYIILNNSLNNVTETNNKICKVVSGNSSTIGSEFTCTFSDGVPRTFYVLEDGDNTTLTKGTTGTAGSGEVSLIMNMNKTNETTAWNIAGTTIDGPVTANEYLKNSTNTWKNVEVSLPTANQLAIAGGDTNWRSDTQTTGKSLESWLWENLKEEDFLEAGYWTSTIYDSENSWVVDDIDNTYGAGNGRLITANVTETSVYGVRPVITLSKSLVKDSVTKEDTENKITLTATSASVISGSTELKVESIATDSETYTEIKKYVTNIENIKVYDINLYENGNIVQPNGKVTLTFEVENMDINKVKVYRMNDDKTYTKIESKVVDNKIQIEVDHFSIYILTEDEITGSNVVVDKNNESNVTDNNITLEEDQVENPNTGEKIIYVTSMSILVVLLIASIIVKLKKK